MRDSEFEFIRSLVYERTRISLGQDKRDLVVARLGKRLRATRLETVGDYCKLLKAPAGSEELGFLIDVISTHHTFFFRENEHFEFVRRTAVPELLARARAERWPKLRAWSAACSSGEEPYSLAVTLTEALAGNPWPWQIEATDISQPVIDRARAAIYKAESLGQMSPERVRAHFQRGIGPQAGNFRVKAALRAGIAFRQLNLADPLPYPEPFHLIFCRNVMIYFDKPTQEELVGKLARALVPGGYLLVGHSESLTGIRHPLESVRPAVYRRPSAS